jgi:ATP-binding cassette subfamily F protein uup
MLNMLGFPYSRHRQLVSSLSGGERRRLHLACVLAQKPNFLILDEPTNDLDLSTIEVRPSLLPFLLRILGNALVEACMGAFV